MTARRTGCWVGLFALLLMSGCSEGPPAAKKEVEPAKPPEPVTGQYAFYQMYGVARAWAPDAEALQVRSLHLSEVPKVPGKAGAWEATFVSPSRSRARTYTYSVVEAAGNLHKGVFAGLEESWSGPRPQAKPFPPSAVKIDTDKAYQIAVKHSAAYAKKNPDLPISFTLQWTTRHPVPAWRVIWGESASTSAFSVFVDCGAGTYLETIR
ncbi:MAG: hypothetical protein ACUVXB_03380 [Bryobacteraceae bacterium]